MPQLPIDPSDANFLRHALRSGTWERYEHPTKGDTLTLQVGQFPVISIHAVLVDGPVRPTESFMDDINDPQTVALLLAKVARLQEQLQTAASIIAERGAEDFKETEDHRWIICFVGDGTFSVVCSCGYRIDDLSDPDMAKAAARDHEDSVPA